MRITMFRRCEFVKSAWGQSGVLVWLAVALVLGGCAASDAPSLDPITYERSLVRTNQLGIGDRVQVTVFGEPEMTGTYSVDAQGKIAFPLVGSLGAAGLSVNGFRDQLRRRLSSGYLSDPKITVEIKSYRPIFVHGEVRKGGEYDYKIGTRLKDAVAIAGGFNYRANEDQVLLTREGETGKVWVRVEDNILILPGDNIRVVERFF